MSEHRNVPRRPSLSWLSKYYDSSHNILDMATPGPPAQTRPISEGEMKLLQKADIQTVREQLAKVETILNSEELDPDFSAVTYTSPDTGSRETFLHLIFLADLRHGPLAVKETDYKEASDAVLSKCEEWVQNKDKEEKLTKFFNMENNQHKTVLHFAIENWSKEVVKRLLNLRLELSIGDVLDEIGVLSIHPSTFEDFLDTMWKPW